MVYTFPVSSFFIYEVGMFHFLTYLLCMEMKAVIECVYGLTNKISLDRFVRVSMETLKQRATTHNNDNFMVKAV